jgi:2-aminoadipate transaminase
MHEALDRHLGETVAEWHEPEGGFFFWLRLAGHSSRSLFERAVEEKVAFVPGPAFYPDADEQVGKAISGDEFGRLCFTFADAAAIDEGCRRLARAIASG